MKSLMLCLTITAMACNILAEPTNNISSRAVFIAGDPVQRSVAEFELLARHHLIAKFGTIDTNLVSSSAHVYVSSKGDGIIVKFVFTKGFGMDTWMVEMNNKAEILRSAFGTLGDRVVRRDSIRIEEKSSSP